METSTSIAFNNWPCTLQQWKHPRVLPLTAGHAHTSNGNIHEYCLYQLVMHTPAMETSTSIASNNWSYTFQQWKHPRVLPITAGHAHTSNGNIHEYCLYQLVMHTPAMETSTSIASNNWPCTLQQGKHPRVLPLTAGHVHSSNGNIHEYCL